MRDGLYNALTPLISTLFVTLIIFVELIPIMFVVITYQAAVSTEFLKTPFYALVYFIFASLMTILSVYLTSSSLLGLIAVSAPGLYPLNAIETARNLIAGRRIRFLVRLIYLFFCVALIYVIVVLPAILLDILVKGAFPWLKDLSIPFVPAVLLIVTVFVFIFVSIYAYLFYRQLLDYKDDFYPVVTPKKIKEKSLKTKKSRVRFFQRIKKEKSSHDIKKIKSSDNSKENDESA